MDYNNEADSDFGRNSSKRDEVDGCNSMSCATLPSLEGEIAQLFAPPENMLKPKADVCDQECTQDNNQTLTADNCFFPSVIDRYFVRLYCVSLADGKMDTPAVPNMNHVKILRHSNKICLITLAPSHPVFTNAEIKSVSFKISSKCDRSLNKVSGKRKKGAQWLNPECPLCIITTKDDNVYTIRPGIRGNLIEVNEKLIKSPGLLLEETETNGYIAIMMLKLEEKDKLIEGLLNQDEYDKYIDALSTNFLGKT